MAAYPSDIFTNTTSDIASDYVHIFAGTLASALNSAYLNKCILKLAISCRKDGDHKLK